MHYSLKSELLGVNTKMGFLHCEEKLFYKPNVYQTIKTTYQ